MRNRIHVVMYLVALLGTAAILVAIAGKVVSALERWHVFVLREVEARHVRSQLRDLARRAGVRVSGLRTLTFSRTPQGSAPATKTPPKRPCSPAEKPTPGR